jgi:hypothetical protein
MTTRTHETVRLEPRERETRRPERTLDGALLDRLGNRGLAALRAYQAKSAISTPDDPLELIADQVADQVVADPPAAIGPAPPPVDEPAAPGGPDVLREALPGYDRRDDHQPETPGAPTAPAPPRTGGGPSPHSDVASALLSGLDAGTGLPADVREFMETRFDRSFADVRIHTGAQAATAAESVAARAFTVGSEIVFGAGEYAPEGPEGRRLLAHELAHVVQQGGATGAPAPESVTEAEADNAAYGVIEGRPPDISERASPGVIQRSEKDSEPGGHFLPAGENPHLAPGTISVQGNYIADVVTVDGGQPDIADVSAWEWGENNENLRLTITVRTKSTVEKISDGRWKHVELNLVQPLLPSPVPRRPPTLGPPRSKAIHSVPGKEPTSQGVSAPSSPQVLPELVIGTNDDVVTEAARPEPSRPATQSRPAEAPEPASPTGLIDRHTSWGNLDEAALGQNLLDRILAGDPATAESTLDALGSTDRDDVSFEIASKATNEQLDTIAGTEPGRRLLLRLYDELTSGFVWGDERTQAERILSARARTIDPEKFRSAAEKAMVIPFSRIGFFNFSSASISAHRLPNGKIWVRSHMTPEHWKDAKRLPRAFAAGLGREFDPDEVIVLHKYDEGGKDIPVPAMALLGLSNEEDKNAASMAAQSVLAGLSLGTGAMGAAASRITVGRLATSMGIGGVLSGVRQELEIAEGLRTERSLAELGWGALMGGGLVIVPQLGAPLAASGLVTGVTEVAEGHYKLGAFDLGTVLLAYRATEPAKPAAPKEAEVAMPKPERLPTANELLDEAERVEARLKDLRAEADLLKERAVRAEGNPERQTRLLERAALRRRVVTEVENDVVDIRKAATQSEAQARATELPGPEEIDELLDAAQSDHEPYRIELGARERRASIDRSALPRLTRALTTTDRGNRVVYRVQGGAGAKSSKELITIGPGNHVQFRAGETINLNFGSYDRALEFLAKRPGAHIVAFEVPESWLQRFRSAAIPEQGTQPVKGASRLVDVEAAEDQIQVHAHDIRALEQQVVPGSGRIIIP